MAASENFSREGPGPWGLPQPFRIAGYLKLAKYMGLKISRKAGQATLASANPLPIAYALHQGRLDLPRGQFYTLQGLNCVNLIFKKNFMRS